MHDPQRINRIKFDLGTVPELLRRHGVEVKRNAFRCFLSGHNDDDPSGSIFDGGSRWKCHSCNHGGDVLDAFAHLKGMTVAQAIEKLGRDYDRDSGSQRKAPRTERKRLSLPAMTSGTIADHNALAGLRNVSRDAVTALVIRGLLHFGNLKGHRAWVLTNSTERNAQARRTDGGLWEHIGGSKAWSLPGSKAAWPIGLPEAHPFPCIALVEGGPDLLAAMHFALAEEAQDRVAPVCITGSGPIPEDALPYFAGKRVRLYPHLDDAGQKAGNQWYAQLKGRGVEVDAFSFDGLRQADGSPIGDLNDLCHIDADQFEAERPEVWEVMP